MLGRIGTRKNARGTGESCTAELLTLERNERTKPVIRFGMAIRFSRRRAIRQQLSDFESNELRVFIKSALSYYPTLRALVRPYTMSNCQLSHAADPLSLYDHFAPFPCNKQYLLLRPPCVNHHEGTHISTVIYGADIIIKRREAHFPVAVSQRALSHFMGV